MHKWGGTSDNNLRPLHVLQKRAVRLITNNDSIRFKIQDYISQQKLHPLYDTQNTDT